MGKDAGTWFSDRWAEATHPRDRRRLADELQMSGLELFRAATLAGLPTCAHCDPGDQVVVVLTRRFGGGVAHVCLKGRSAQEMAYHLVTDLSDPDDYILIDGRSSVPIAAVAEAHVLHVADLTYSSV